MRVDQYFLKIKFVLQNFDLIRMPTTGHGAGSCPAFPNRTPTTDLDHVAGCPRSSSDLNFNLLVLKLNHPHQLLALTGALYVMMP